MVKLVKYAYNYYYTQDRFRAIFIIGVDQLPMKIVRRILQL